MAMSENTVNVLNYLQAHNNEDLTAADVAQALGMDTKVVNGVFTFGVIKKGFGKRVEAEVEVEEDGAVKHKTIKFLKLTDAGMACDTSATDEE